MRPKVIIFDFDGTIADSFDVFVESIEEVLKHPHPFTAAEIADLRGLSTREVIKKLGVKKWQIPVLAIKGRAAVASKMDRVNVFSGMPRVISQLADRDNRLYILSSNSKEAVDGFLAHNELAKKFTAVYTGTSIFGKARALSKLLKKEGLMVNDCIYVGDETRDVEAAREVSIKSVAVAWGYSTPKALESYQPDALASRPGDLVRCIDSLQS